MLRKLLKICMLAICAISATSLYSSPAYPGLVEFRQPDGTTVNVYVFGDEFLHWAETEDGYTLLYDGDGYLSYAEHDGITGNLVPSKMRPAKKAAKRKTREKTFLKSLDKHLRFSNAQVENAKQLRELIDPDNQSSAGSNALRNSPRRSPYANAVTGNKRILLILVDFADVPFLHTKADFDLLMNQLNYTADGRYGSVRDFYLENSFGKLNMVTDVAGIYHLANNRAYYGGASSSGGDKNPRAMATEAVVMADDDVNYADYDNDGDGIVDGVHIIYAGPGEEAGGGADCIWAHSSSINVTLDNKRLYRYSCSPEIRGSGGNSMTHIGVICHEIGHVLGCMDFYDTNYSLGGQYQGTGNWDLMGSGNWNGNGACPAHFNPYVKIYDFGWAEPIDANVATTITLKGKSEAGFARIDTKTQGEYFLLEYRSQSGFDACLPGHGLMAYRASADLQSGLSMNTANAYHKQKFYPICANATAEMPTNESSSYGTVNSGSAPFPGTGKVYGLTDYTTPSMKSWAGATTDFPITSIAENMSAESITFDVAGGISGGAYGLKVTASDLSSIALAWEKQASEQVLLVVSDEISLGAPESGKTYSVGSVIADCGTVVYAGTNTQATHTGLQEGEEYFYKLYTLKSDSTWTVPRTLKARTQLGVIRKFPYINDFEDGQLDESWEQESILSSRMQWTVTDMNDKASSVYPKRECKLEANFTEFPTSKEKVRLKLPPLDFTGKKCAVISFDYTNFMSEMILEYRMSPTDEWHELRTFDSMFNGISTSTTQEDVKNATVHTCLQLPNLTSTYELSFIATYYLAGSSYSYIETILIDNLQIEADYDVVALTGKPIQVLGSEAVVEAEALDGLKTVVSRGVEWKTSQGTWTTVESSTSQVSLKELPNGTTIYYCAYAIDQDGAKYRGDVRTLTTQTFSNGKGTADSPYIIASASDWNSFCSYVNAGNACTNVHFALGASFTLSSNTTISKTFDGTFDGRGHTLAPASGTYKSLFYLLGQDGCIKNLNVKASALSTGASESAGICSCNLGLITECNVDFGTLSLISPGCFGGIVAKNNGWITDCTSNLNVSGERITVGGICWYNYNVISGCTSYGNMSANNNASLGGIAATNHEGFKDGKNANGLISNCRNYANIGNYLVDEKSYSYRQGGICAATYGKIENCVNYGDITQIFGGDASVGGIVGSVSRCVVVDCVNYGKIALDNSNNTDQRSCHAGGVVGFYDQNANVINCLNVGEIELAGTYYSNSYGAVGGTNRESQMNNCWFTNNFQDQSAGKATAAEAVEQLNRGLTDGGLWVLDANGTPALRSLDYGTQITIDRITGFAPDHIDVQWSAFGDNILEGQLQWRRIGGRVWNDIPGVNGIVNKTTITGLTPKTVYEIRGLAHTKTGESITTDIDTVATMFTGTGLGDSPFVIDDYDELVAFSRMIAHGETFCTQKVVLAHDIDMHGAEGVLWKPMRSELAMDYFQGEFDGSGHVLHNMTIDTKVNYVGLFSISNGYIHDLTIRGASIKCYPHQYTSWSTYETGCGVGAFVGYTSSSLLYPHLLERCGFEGVIDNGNCLGALVGRTNGNEAIKDCYANAKLITKTTGVSFYAGGLIGYGNAVNSYFAGTITKPSYVYGKVGAISGKASEGTPDVGCFYESTCGYSSTTSTSRTTDEMKSKDFLSALSSGIWTFAEGINDGYPVLASCNTTRTTTDGARTGDEGTVVLSAIACDGDAGTATGRGFQYFPSEASQMEMYFLASADKGIIFKAELENIAVPKSGINYRAYSVYNNVDTVFGDWKTYIPTIILPRLNLIAVTLANGVANAIFAIDSGTEAISKCALVTLDKTGARFVDTLNQYESKGAITLPDFDKAPFRSFITCTTTGGREFCSDTLAWEPTTEPPLQAGYAMSMPDMTARVGTTFTLPLSMQNREAICGLQFDLGLPKGVALKSAEMAARAKGLMPAFSLSDGQYKFSVLSLMGDTILDNEGELLTLSLAVDESMAPGDYTVELSSILLFAENGDEIPVASCTANLGLKNYTIGDVNDNGTINTNDAIAIVNFVICKPQNVFIEEAADVNGNGTINTNDAIAIVNYVIGKTNSLRVKPKDETEAPAFLSLQNNGGNCIGVTLHSDGKYQGFQCEIELPNGVGIENIALNNECCKDHTIFFNHIADNRYAVAALSLNGNTICGCDGELFTIKANGDGHGSMNVYNVWFFTNTGKEVQLTSPTPIAYVTVDDNTGQQDANVYDLTGRKIDKVLRPGVYIINGKKVYKNEK